MHKESNKIQGEISKQKLIEIHKYKQILYHKNIFCDIINKSRDT